MILKDLMRKRSVEHNTDTRLNKSLSAFDLMLLGIGGIIGTGIFVLTGVAAATQAGPAIVLSFIIAGIPCALAALAYSELAASVGGAGSAYGYSYAAFGEFIAWMIGWDLLLEYGVSLAAVATGWSGYFSNMLNALGFALPEALTKGPAAGGIINLPASLIILVLMGILVVGVKHSARLNNGVVFIKLLTIFVFIAIAVPFANTANWSNFMPYGWFDTLADGKTVGVLAAASVVFFAYVGFDAVSVAVEEAKNPQRDIPIGIIGSLLFCTVIYIVVSGLLTLVVPYTDLNVSSPVAHVLQLLGVNWASGLVAAGVIGGLTTVMLVLYYGLTRVIFAMGRDGLLPQAFAAVNPKTQTPVRATVICGALMAIAAGLVPLGVLAELVNIGTLFAFVLVCAGVVALRLSHPDLPRPFKVPGGIVLPVLGALSCLALIAFLPVVTHLRFLAWLALGVVLYFVYARHHSHLNPNR